MLFLLIFGLFFSVSQAQRIVKKVYPDKYLVEFTDKKNSPYSLEQPEKFLSQKSIERRRNYHLSLDESDLPVNPEYLAALKKLGVKILNVSKWLNSCTVLCKDTTVLQKIYELPFVKKPHSWRTNKKNYEKIYTEISRIQIPVKKNEVDLEKLEKKYGEAANQIAQLNGHLLHEMGFRGRGITIAILDAGFFNVHSLPAFDSLWKNKQILGTRDFVDGDSSVFDASTHGMEVLSTIGGNIPGKLVGTAPDANFWLLRSEDAYTEYIIEEHNWACAAEFADSVGADVINSSLGYFDFDDATQNYSYEDMNGNTSISTLAADFAAKKGILVVNSAGNDGDSEQRHIGAPADADSILSIGAVDKNNEYVYFSSQGPTFDKRIKPNVSAKGLDATVQGRWGNISSSSGTSFSSPILAGMVACLWQAHRNATNMQVIEAIEASSHQFSQPDTFWGFGIPNFYKADKILTEYQSGNTFLKRKLLLYPNPCNEVLFVEFSDNKQEYQPLGINLMIYNVLGELVYSDNKAVMEYNRLMVKQIQHLPRGVYIVKLSAEGHIFQGKLVKQ